MRLGQRRIFFVVILLSVVGLPEESWAETIPSRDELPPDAASVGWSSFKVTAAEDDELGRVTVSGRAGVIGIMALTVDVFGQRHRLDRSHTKKLLGFSVNGMELFHSPNRKVGERRLYIRFSRTFFANSVHRIVIVVPERGDITVERATNTVPAAALVPGSLGQSPSKAQLPTVDEHDDPAVMFNVNSRKFHHPDCPHAVRCTRSCIRISRSEALRRGGIPCKHCGGGLRSEGVREHLEPDTWAIADASRGDARPTRLPLIPPVGVSLAAEP